MEPTTRPSVLDLGDDVLLEISSYLSADEVVVLRQTCRYLFSISRSRYLWHNVLRRDVIRASKPIPAYRKPIHELCAPELEALTRRAFRLDAAPRGPTIARLDGKQSVTWVRLVYGQWLLAAFSSPHSVHTLALYSLTEDEGSKPAQIATSPPLPGPVCSGEVEVQPDQVVIALSFQSKRRMTEVYSVRRFGNDAVGFAKVATLEGLSHVRCLRGSLLALGESPSPCVVNWRTAEVTVLPSAPDPEGAGKILAIALREDICVVIHATSLVIHSLCLTADGGVHVQLLQTINFNLSMASVSTSAEDETFPPPLDEEPSRTRVLLFAASSVSVTVLRLEQLGPTQYALDVVADSQLNHGSVLSSRPSLPRFGGSTSRLAWLHTPTSFFDRTSSLVIARLVVVSSPFTAAAGDAPRAKLEVVSKYERGELPALHASPVMDYDDGSGIVVVGNACGELALGTYAGPVSAELARCLRSVPVPYSGMDLSNRVECSKAGE